MNKIWTGWVTPDWRAMTWPDRLAWFIGSGFGSGFSPIAPGTAGAAAAAVIYCGVMLLLPAEVNAIARLAVWLPIIAVGFALGVWATDRMSTVKDPDPGAAVWDEFVGMWLAALPTVGLDWDWSHPSGLLLSGVWMAVSFFAFRAFDTLKPWPCRQLEKRHGGWGIMLDDVAAGVLALLATLVLFSIVGGITARLWGPVQ